MKNDKLKLNCLTHHGLMEFIDTLPYQKVKSSGIYACSLSCFIHFFFWGILFFLSPLIILLGLFTLFFLSFFFFFFFFTKYVNTTCRRQSMYKFTRLSTVKSKLWPLYYRLLTSASLGDEFSLWNAKNSEIDSLIHWP